MPIKIAEIPYLNSAPFYWNKNDEDLKKFKWISAHPNQIGTLAKKNRIDAGPFSLMDSFELEKNFEPLLEPDKPLGIGVQSSAKSVLLFSKKPVADLNKKRIGLTPYSVTSSKLLQFIMEKKYKLFPIFFTGFNPSDSARLLIGDSALQKSEDIEFKKNFPFMIDLGEEWLTWKGLPFVFARWMVKKSLAPNIKLELFQILKRNLKLYYDSPKLAIQWFEKKSGWKYKDALKYLNGFTYELKEKEKKAILDFRELTFFYSLKERTNFKIPAQIASLAKH